MPASPASRRNKRVTLVEVAKEAGVSQAAASVALSDGSGNIGVAANTRQRIRDAARRLGYQPNLTARTLVSGRSRCVGLLVRHLGIPEKNLQVEVMHNVLARRGYQVLLGRTLSHVDGTLASIDEMTRRHVDGLILTDGVKHPDVRQKLARIDTPSVLTDVPYDADYPDAPCVWVDRARAFAELVEALYGSGYDDLLLVIPDINYNTGLQEIWRGMLAAANRKGVRLRYSALEQDDWLEADQLTLRAVDPHVRPMPRSSSVAWRQRHSYHKGRAIAGWADPPRAVLTIGSEFALAMIRGLRDGGRCVPDEIAVTGYEDGLDARYASPSLTTLRMPRRALAGHATNLLMRRMDGEPLPVRGVSLSTRLVIRESAPLDPRYARTLTFGRTETFGVVEAGAAADSGSTGPVPSHELSETVPS